MVDRFWFEILYSLVTNLSSDVDKINRTRNIEQIRSALTHVERVLREKKDLFNAASAKRKVPSEIEGPLLKDAVSWLLKCTGISNGDCRRKCKDMFCNLVDGVEGCDSATDFIRKHVTDDANWYLEIYERNLETSDDIYDHGNDFDVVNWLMNDFSSCIDGYDWLFDLKILSIDQLRHTRLIPSVKYFLDKDIWDVSYSRLIKDYCVLTINEFNDLKCSIVIKVFYLIIRFEGAKIREFDYGNLWRLLIRCVYEPQTLGFDVIGKKETDKFTETFTDILNKLYGCLTMDQIDDLSVLMSDKFIKEEFNSSETSENIPISQRQLLKGLLIIRKSQFGRDNKVNFTPKLSANPEKIFNKLVDGNSFRYLSGTMTEYLELHLRISFLSKDNVTKLWKLVTSPEKYSDVDFSVKTTHGDYFLKKFEPLLMDYFAENAEEVLINFIRFYDDTNNANHLIIIKILQNLTGKRQRTALNVNNVMKKCDKYFTYSKTLSFKNREFQVDFLTNIIKLYPEPLHNLSETFFYLKNWFLLTVLHYDDNVNAQTLFEFKLKLLDLLPCFTAYDIRNKPLESTLKSFREELIENIIKNPGSSEYLLKNINTDVALTIMFNKWLDVLAVSKSQLVLSCVVDLIVRIEDANITVKLERKLRQYFHKLNLDCQYDAVKSVKDMCYDEQYSYEQRYSKICGTVLALMLRNCSYDCFEHFFVCNIKVMSDILKCEVSNKNINARHLIFSKSVSFLLTEIMFSRIQTSKFVSLNCPITKELFGDENEGCSSNNNNLIKEFCSYARNARKETFDPRDDERELYRVYNCNSLNAFISVISNTKKDASDLKTYEYLFCENKWKNEFIWRKIIECDKTYSFHVLFDQLPTKRNLFSSIRKEIGEKKRNGERKYLETQAIFNSSLSEDITKYDFSNSLLRRADVAEAQSDTYDIEVELTDFNRHECMPTVCAVIQHMVDNKILPLPENEEGVVPEWVKIIRKILLNSEVTNVRLFFAKVVYNLEHIFKYYAKWFFAPIMKIVVDKCAGDSINYFVTEMVS